MGNNFLLNLNFPKYVTDVGCKKAEDESNDDASDVVWQPTYVIM